jgi:FkbM family methyltransferase
VRAALSRRNYALTRPRFHEENEIDLRALLAQSIEKENGRVVVLQIGANDGVANDPIHETVVARDWELYAVEPMPGPFEGLQRNYAGNPRVRFVQCAVGPADGEITLYSLKQDGPVDGLPYDQFSSFSRKTVERHWRYIPDVRDRIVSVRVKSLTLSSLLEQYAIPYVDLLQIDTEGFDYEVLKMAFACGLEPKIIAFEWVNLSKADMWSCRCDLIERGYRWLICKGDVIATRIAPAPPLTNSVQQNESAVAPKGLALPSASAMASGTAAGRRHQMPNQS